MPASIPQVAQERRSLFQVSSLHKLSAGSKAKVKLLDIILASFRSNKGKHIEENSSWFGKSLFSEKTCQVPRKLATSLITTVYTHCQGKAKHMGLHTVCPHQILPRVLSRILARNTWGRAHQKEADSQAHSSELLNLIFLLAVDQSSSYSFQRGLSRFLHQ